MPSRAATPPAVVPWVEWSTLLAKVNHMWDPENSPHHSIVGLTGAGKSYLAINGILKPLCHTDRVLIIDTKQDDPLVSQTGRGCSEIPNDSWWHMGRHPDDRETWFRLVVSDNRSQGQRQLHDALARVYKEGDWVVYFDELRDVTDPARDSGYGLKGVVDHLYRKGRSRRISIVAATQSPSWVPRSFYDQASFAWLGRIRDEQRQKRLLEIGGMTKDMLPNIAELERRQWLLSADNGEFFARSKVV